VEAGSKLKMEATCSFETSVDFRRTTRRYIPEDIPLHIHRCENLKSYKGYKRFVIANDSLTRAYLGGNMIAIPGQVLSSCSAAEPLTFTSLFIRRITRLRLHCSTSNYSALFVGQQ
jgi:hypothetical protein